MQKSLSSLRSALISTHRLREVVNNKPKNTRILDSAWHFANTGRVASEEYKTQHIPGAVFFDIENCADKSNDVPYMIPSPDEFEKYVSDLGINNDTHVFVYDNSPQYPIFSAQRVWWMFRVFGHNNVSVLNGGLQKWLSEDGPTTSDVENVNKENFQAEFQPQLVKSYADIVQNIKDGKFQVVDTRPEARFKGTAPEPKPDIKPGCIVGTKNIPFSDTLDFEKKAMKNPDELKKIFEDENVDLEKPLIATCGYGITACMLALAAHECGNDQVSIYDGSWTEWYLKAPEDLKLNVPSE